MKDNIFKEKWRVILNPSQAEKRSVIIQALNDQNSLSAKKWNPRQTLRKKKMLISNIKTAFTDKDSKEKF